VTGVRHLIAVNFTDCDAWRYDEVELFESVQFAMMLWVLLQLEDLTYLQQHSCRNTGTFQRVCVKNYALLL